MVSYQADIFFLICSSSINLLLKCNPSIAIAQSDILFIVSESRSGWEGLLPLFWVFSFQLFSDISDKIVFFFLYFKLITFDYISDLVFVRGKYLIAPAQIAKVLWNACRLPYGQQLWLVSRKMLQEQPKMFWILCSFCRLPKFFVLSFQIDYRRARSARFDKVKANLFGSSPMPSWFWFISLFEQFEDDLDE